MWYHGTTRLGWCLWGLAHLCSGALKGSVWSQWLCGLSGDGFTSVSLELARLGLWVRKATLYMSLFWLRPCSNSPILNAFKIAICFLFVYFKALTFPPRIPFWVSGLKWVCVLQSPLFKWNTQLPLVTHKDNVWEWGILQKYRRAAVKHKPVKLWSQKWLFHKLVCFPQFYPLLTSKYITQLHLLCPEVLQAS